MADLKISGIWKDDKGVITHYAIHTKTPNGHTRARKTAKAAAIALVNTKDNTAVTWLWDYQTAFWKIGETVKVVDNSYLRSNPDNKLTDNLGHLLDYDWLG